MSIAGFQGALCDLIASPPLCLALRDDPDMVPAGHDLTPRERRRLRAIVWQRGMSTSCSLYRSNRVTPIYRQLTVTCLMLGDLLRPLLDEFWSSTELESNQFLPQVEKFARFLRRRIDAGSIQSRVLEDVLELELATITLQLTSRRRLLADLDRHEQPPQATHYRLHPLSRLLRLHHDPSALLRAVDSQTVPPADIVAGDHHAIVSMLAGRLEFMEVPAPVGRLLSEGAIDGACTASPGLIGDLLKSGLLIPA